MKKKEKFIKISPKDFEDFIWMSYRYCIGRKTIAAAYHAETIRKYIYSNPDALSEERKIFMAQDIIKEINNIIKWRDNVKVDGINDNLELFSFLLYKASKRKYTNVNFHINTYTEEMEFPPCLPEKYIPYDRDYNDLIKWVKLANFLNVNEHKQVHTNFNNKEEVYTCYSYPCKNENGIYEKRYTTLDKDIILTTWIDPKYITKIE